MKYWRIAFDERREWKEVKSAIQLLRANGIPQHEIFCYVLAGNESFEDCMWRAERVVKWGGEPRIQMMKPLTWLHPRKEVWINPAKNWTQEQAVNFPRYWYSYAWRRIGWEEWVAAGYRYAGPDTTDARYPAKLRATRRSAASRWEGLGAAK